MVKRGTAEERAFDMAMGGTSPHHLSISEACTHRPRCAVFPWDNCTFHLGTDMVLRFPSVSEYAEAVDKAHRWLHALGPSLPLPIPIPLAKGAPSADYPYPWSVYRWLDGHTASADLIARPVTFATDLAAFLAALQALDATAGPQPGIHNWFRGGTLRTYDNNTQRALKDLQGHIDIDLAGRVWADALSTPWDGIDRWFHGDIAEGTCSSTTPDN